MVLCREDLITTRDLPFHLQEGKSELSEFTKKEKGLPEALEEIEKDLIIKALHQHQWVQTKAAENLRISERVLRYKIKKYKLRSDEVKEA